MNHVFRFTIIFLTVLLIGTAIAPGQAKGLSYDPNQSGKSNILSSCFAKSQFTLTPQQHGNNILSNSNYPAPVSKNNISHTEGINAFTIALFNTGYRYLLHANEIRPGLTIRETIYPFHSFW